jgi:predicted metal-dependent hydrolase
MDEIPFSLNTPTPCEETLHPLAIEGLRLFNAGQYFEAHEALETAWKDEKGPIRELYRGILQVAVGYLHITRGNYIGALKMFKRCRPWLAPFPDQCRGIEVGQLKRDFQAVESELRRLGPQGIQSFNPRLLKPAIWKEIEDPKEKPSANL